MKTPVPRTGSATRQLGAAILDAHPVATVVVDDAFRIVHANGAARRLLGAREGVKLVDALPCLEPRAPGGCGAGARCASCAFHRSVERALAGESVRARGFVLRNDRGTPADLHLLASAAPFERDGARHAILALEDANAILGDPGVVRVCDGCGRVQDEEGGWHPLHRYLEDRLGLEGTGPLCDACNTGRPSRP
ncbi:MAG TPA: PAS domain-containing protein [Anaeromyxobacter sp.]